MRIPGLKRLRRWARKRARRYSERSTIPLPAIGAPPEGNREIAVATIFKDEAPYIAEWIDFHRFLGVSHFYFYDNGSADDGPEIVRSYTRLGLATLIPWRNFNPQINLQTLGYAHALSNFGASYRWMGFFDIDEFMCPMSGASLTETLDGYLDVAALGVVGLHFGTSGHATPPEGLVIEAYRQAASLRAQASFPPLLNTKCFVQPSKIVATKNAHSFGLAGTDAVCFTEARTSIRKAAREQPGDLSCDVIRYNHYFTRSQSEFEAKLTRSSVRGPSLPVVKQLRPRMFAAIEGMATPDHAIDVHLGAFKAWRAAEAARGAAALDARP
ncbi:glycosyltransferase family 92 protein [Methylopila sp. 73B]|uniref:glycosyltransferase family 92 protein n=1 Tax=Methylopila sp. 73B TaxID=1120792 RepID=UPI0003690E69|nr:glycosyltransferase family 92 protein [Methylopila sp. 73B]